MGWAESPPGGAEKHWYFVQHSINIYCGERAGGRWRLEQRDGAPPSKRIHHPTARSERWEHKAQPPPGLWGWERLTPIQHSRGAPQPLHSPALGTGQLWGGQQAGAEAPDGWGGPGPSTREVNGVETSSVQGAREEKMIKRNKKGNTANKSPRQPPPRRAGTAGGALRVPGQIFMK